MRDAVLRRGAGGRDRVAVHARYVCCGPFICPGFRRFAASVRSSPAQTAPVRAACAWWLLRALVQLLSIAACAQTDDGCGLCSVSGHGCVYNARFMSGGIRLHWPGFLHGRRIAGRRVLRRCAQWTEPNSSWRAARLPFAACRGPVSEINRFVFTFRTTIRRGQIVRAPADGKNQSSLKVLTVYAK